MEAIVQNHPEGIAIIFANNDDMAIAAKRVVEGNPAYENTIFCGCGGNTAAMQAILNGEETMTVAVDGYDVGYRGVEAAVNALEGNTPDAFIASPATIVTIDNAEEHMALVQEKGKRQGLNNIPRRLETACGFFTCVPAARIA